MKSIPSFIPAVWRSLRRWLGGLALMGLTGAGMAQSGVLWTHLPEPPASRVGAERWVAPTGGAIFAWDEAAFRGGLRAVPPGEPWQARAVGALLPVPLPDGTVRWFRVVESGIMEPGLAVKFPEIKTFAGEAVDDPATTLRADVTPAGFHAQILGPEGAIYVDPAYRGDTSHYVSYRRAEQWREAEAFQCLVPGGETVPGAVPRGEGERTLFGATLRTYRLACAATGEYTQFHGGTVAQGQAAIVTAINRINGIFEREFAVRLILVANNDLLVFTNPGSDPYTNDDGVTMLTQNQTTVNSIIGSANYDIGHVFSTGGGGVASLGSVCSSTRKAQGVTGSSSPTGDSFWVDYVAHEMGHQFGANHTFNATSGSCGFGNRNASTATEPGSGSTIMAYAGICAPNNLQPNSDPYFHATSLAEILAFLNGSGGACAANVPTGNAAPSVDAGPAYVIPARTPFALTAIAADPNGDALTYCWEQMDTGAAQSLNDPDNGSSPLFRSFPPTNNPTRFFPRLTSVLANTNWNQEKLPVLNRTMKFRVTVRDNRAGGGGVADADTTVTVISNAGPFVVTAPNSAVTWSNVQTVTWNVAGTAAAPINTAGVNIWLSTNGGLHFPFLLASNVPNTGAAEVVLPPVSSTRARIKVEGAGNIFYDVSDTNFTVVPGLPIPLLVVERGAVLLESCPPGNQNVDPGETVTMELRFRNIGLASTTNLLATLLATNGVLAPGPAETLGVIAPGQMVTRAFTFTASGPCASNVNAQVRLTDNAAVLGQPVVAIPMGSPVVVTQQFTSTAPITINTFGTALPYPGRVNVAGVDGNVIKTTIRLNGLSHTRVSDIAVLAEGPGGQTVMLLGYPGAATASSAQLVFDDNASGPVPGDGGVLLSGTWLPTDNSAPPLTAPAPAGPYGTSVNALAATPNGEWKLYVQDFLSTKGGSIPGGWTVTLVTSNRVCCTAFPPPTLAATSVSGNAAHLRWQTVPGARYQVEFRTNLVLGAWQNLGGVITGIGGETNFTDHAATSPERYYRIRLVP
jgi:hypothetical protein